MASRVVLFCGLNPIETGESKCRWNPLSILAVGSALQEAGYEPVLLDPQIHEDWPDRLRKLLPDTLFLGVSCMTGPGIRNVLKAISVARAARADIPIVWGGYHATLAYAGILRERLADV